MPAWPNYLVCGFIRQGCLDFAGAFYIAAHRTSHNAICPCMCTAGLRDAQAELRAGGLELEVYLDQHPLSTHSTFRAHSAAAANSTHDPAAAAGATAVAAGLRGFQGADEGAAGLSSSSSSMAGVGGSSTQGGPSAWAALQAVAEGASLIVTGVQWGHHAAEHAG